MRPSFSTSLFASAALLLGLPLAACSPETRNYGSGPSGSSSGTGGGTNCPAGKDDCDGDGECETNVSDNPEHCGGCNVACQLACKGTTCDDPVHIAAGYDHTCAVLAGGDLYCWGRNTSGQLGIDTYEAAPAPTKVHTTGPVVQVSLGGTSYGSFEGGAMKEVSHTCAVLKDTTVQCWGNNASGQLGIGSSGGQPKPTTVVSLVGAKEVSAGGRHTCAVTAMEGGTSRLHCWGLNDAGQLGIGQVGANEQTAIPVTGLAGDVTHVSAGKAHTCATRVDGTLSCWGDNMWGRLGIGSQVDQPSPQLVSLTGVERVAAGGEHTCALKDGGVFCWGNGYQGQLGIENEYTWREAPSVPTSVPNAIFVAAGVTSTVAISGDGGNVYMWSAGLALGNGTDASSYVPVKLALGDVVEVAAGRFHTCALTKRGQVLCWGGNTHGQLGTGTASDALALSPTPVQWPSMP
jgi:alpha-tubulin suppressor-like RCC1 family protein